MTLPHRRATGGPTHLIGNAAYESLLRQLGAAHPADVTYARCMSVIELHAVAWHRQMRLMAEAYEDGIGSKAGRAARQAAEARYAEGDALAELAGILEAAGDDAVSEDLRHGSTVPRPRRRPVAPTLLLLPGLEVAA
jgi:hypothetical protein